MSFEYGHPHLMNFYTVTHLCQELTPTHLEEPLHGDPPLSRPINFRFNKNLFLYPNHDALYLKGFSDLYEAVKKD